MEKIDIDSQKRKLMIERLRLKELLLDLGVPHPDDEFDLDPIADASLDVDPAEESEVADAMNDYMIRVGEEMALEKRYRDVHAALLEIQSGGYGICLECDKPISAGRLMANPAALYCSEHMENDFQSSAL
jgi:RNA polymerase-binding transcription factor DksA